MTLDQHVSNPFLSLDYEPALEALDSDYFDEVAAAEFPQQILRFRNDDLLPVTGLDPERVSDADFIDAFGKFRGRSPFLALRYHGYQFGEYNAFLGDGRGFLYGQVRGRDGELYDLGTKGSGTTPYSRGGDGRLTLKGGVREVIAAEALHRMGVRTSRCLSLIETGEALGGEMNPRLHEHPLWLGSVALIFASALLSGLHYLGRKDLTQRLLEHVIEHYYPHLLKERDRYVLFYAELVERVAKLVAQWMAAGFCHAVLNTDNMSITGESFDYGPYAFINTYDPQFTAAYFDYFGRYCYGNQPTICHWNLKMLQIPLASVIPEAEMETGLAKYAEHYRTAYCQQMLKKLGFVDATMPEAQALVEQTVQLLQGTQVSYHAFFAELAQQFSENWREDGEKILLQADFAQTDEHKAYLIKWRQLYYYLLLESPISTHEIIHQLQQYNPPVVPVRPRIEAIWALIEQEDNWQLFYEWLDQIRN